jgi:hypothetical protein
LLSDGVGGTLASRGPGTGALTALTRAAPVTSHNGAAVSQISQNCQPTNQPPASLPTEFLKSDDTHARRELNGTHQRSLRVQFANPGLEQFNGPFGSPLRGPPGCQSRSLLPPGIAPGQGEPGCGVSAFPRRNPRALDCAQVSADGGKNQPSLVAYQYPVALPGYQGPWFAVTW